MRSWLVALLGLLSGFATRAPLPVVSELDLERYQGLWHEIARLPTRFQKGCTRSTATYETLTDGRVKVVNRCLRDGEWKMADGTAWVEGPEPSKLRVRFFWPFSGAYWVIALDPDYQWSLVGHPSREYLWILSRAPEMDPAQRAQLENQAARLGFDVSRLIQAD
jgi:apolipoprotein D and lipocalin family protein